MDGGMDGGMNGWRDEWIDRWMDMHIHKHTYIQLLTLTLVSLYRFGNITSNRSLTKDGLLWAAELNATRATLRTFYPKREREKEIIILNPFLTQWNIYLTLYSLTRSTSDIAIINSPIYLQS